MSPWVSLMGLMQFDISRLNAYIWDVRLAQAWGSIESCRQGREAPTSCLGLRLSPRAARARAPLAIFASSVQPLNIAWRSQLSREAQVPTKSTRETTAV